MDGTRLLLVICVAFLGETLGITLKRWSEPSTWVGSKLPERLCDVRIYEPILMDMEDVELGNVTIDAGGLLVFDNDTAAIKFSARNIFVYGTLQIGSEEYPYTSHLLIELTGDITDHPENADGKVIKIFQGGTFEEHGEIKQSWTKLIRTINPLSDQDDFYYYNHTTDQYRNERVWWQGVAAYTVDMSGVVPNVTTYGVYSLPSRGHLLADQINALNDGDILMMTSQRNVTKRADDPEEDKAYDALETLLYGSVTNNSALRLLPSDGSTWALVVQKGGVSDEQTNPRGTQSGVDIVVTKSGIDYIFMAYVRGDDFSSKVRRNNFVITEMEGLYPKIDLLDNINDTSWKQGDRLVIASTDSVPDHAEVVSIINCDNCASNQIRINRPLMFKHFGEILYGAVDMRAEVGLLSRNVVFQGKMADTCPEENKNCNDTGINNEDTFGGQIKVMEGYANVHMQHVELNKMGQQTAQGKYPIHFHLCLSPSNAAPYVKSVSIHKSFARCCTVHGSHNITIMDMVCYDHVGHGLFLEDGGELDTVIDGNLVLLTKRGPGKIGEPTDFTSPTSFWITDPRTTFRNNHASGSDSTGIWFVFPSEPLPPSRNFSIMEKFEARRTDVTEFDNNVAHSNKHFGIQVSRVLTDDRTIHGNNKWQPLENPLDTRSRPVTIKITRATVYMNVERNIWVEGGLIDLSRVSSSDSKNGITLTKPRFGIATWKGPIEIVNAWFADFNPDVPYDFAAIAKRLNSPYFFSITTSVKNALRAFDDGPTTGRLTMSGDASTGWGNRDGEKMSGFTWYNQTNQRLYVVKPDHLSCAAVDARYRPNWRMCISATKYGNWRLGGGLRGTGTVFVRDDLPSAQLNFIMQMGGGPQVVLDGTRTYTAHFTTKAPSRVVLIAEGIEAGDVLRVGVCLPSGFNFTLRSTHPYNLFDKDFVWVDSLADLDALSSKDGKKVFFNSTTGMLYYKFYNPTTRSEDEPNSCANGKCPALKVSIQGNLTNVVADCRTALYGDLLNMTKPDIPLIDEVFPANGESIPPQEWGAGSSFPFTNRDPVDGAYGEWSDWGKCTQSCGGGTQTRTRRCDDPKPRNGGNACSGDPFETRDCPTNPCPINGGLSQWADWGDCINNPSDSSCNGYKLRVRTCSNPQPEYGGRYCNGFMSQSIRCFIPDCP